MAILVFLEFCTVLLNIREEKVVEKPQVMRVVLLKKVKPAQTSEKCPPCSCKTPPNF